MYIFFIFTPNLGEMMQFDEHIFQMGWFNHQLGNHYQWEPSTHNQVHWSEPFPPSAAMMAEDLAQKWLRNCFEAGFPDKKRRKFLKMAFRQPKKGGGGSWIEGSNKK